MCKPDARYHNAIVITNRALVEGDFLTQMARVLFLHPHAVILREKDLTDAAYEVLARELLAMCGALQIPCFLHGRINLAKKLGCRRIHLPLAEMIGMAHPCLREDFDEISVSCHSMEDMQQAVACGATQIVLGTIFETECKKGLKGRGLDFVREITAACPVPVYAIGGINLEKISLVKEAGAAGGCMMSGFMKLS